MTKLLLGRKGLGMNDLSVIGTTFIVVGILLGVGVYINGQLGETMATTSTVTNETVNFAANATWYNLVYPARSISVVSNGTHPVGSGNYTLRTSGTTSQANLTLVIPGAIQSYYAGNYNVTYTIYNGTQYLVAQNATDSIAKLSSWLPIIAIVFAAGIILGLLALAFMPRNMAGGV